MSNLKFVILFIVIINNILVPHNSSARDIGYCSPGNNQKLNFYFSADHPYDIGTSTFKGTFDSNHVLVLCSKICIVSNLLSLRGPPSYTPPRVYPTSVHFMFIFLTYLFPVFSDILPSSNPSHKLFSIS